MNLKITQRGFAIATFTDLFENNCSIQESSLADRDAIWLGVDGNRMHLTREIVRELLPLLTVFVETGGLRQ